LAVSIAWLLITPIFYVSSNYYFPHYSYPQYKQDEKVMAAIQLWTIKEEAQRPGFLTTVGLHQPALVSVISVKNKINISLEFCQYGAKCNYYW
jgi:hypothetical protein